MEIMKVNEISQEEKLPIHYCIVYDKILKFKLAEYYISVKEVKDAQATAYYKFIKDFPSLHDYPHWMIESCMYNNKKED